MGSPRRENINVSSCNQDPLSLSLLLRFGSLFALKQERLVKGILDIEIKQDCPSNILFLVFPSRRIHREDEKTNILKKSKYIPSSYSAGTESPTILLGIGLLFSTLSPIRCSMAFHHPRLYRSGWPEPCTRPVWAGPNRAEKLITIRSLDGEEPSWKKKYLISIPPPNRGNLIDEISIGANFKQFI